MPAPFNIDREFGTLQNWVNGERWTPRTESFAPVYSPYSGKEIASVPLSNAEDIDDAVQAARAAFPSWAETNIKKRVQVMFRLKMLLEDNLDELGELAAIECGKTPGEARAGIEKGIEVIEYSCSMPNLISGGTQEVSSGVDCGLSREPLGVVASIAPFNFPFMVPLWTVPIAITAGNTMLVKSSEQVPLSALRLAELLKEAGLPDGVFNVVNGGREAVEAICDHPEIEAISFVGSSKVARQVYVRGSQSGKRVLALGGAKNHTVLMPDANPDISPPGVVDSATGCAGQRCMAVSAMVGVGEIGPLVEKMKEYAESIELGNQMGAIINKESADRIHRYIDQAEQMGADIIVDGRNATVEGCEGGYWVGPTLIDNVTAEMPIAHDEIFGPVLAIRRVKSLDEAIEIENANPYGNAASIFTSSGEAARHFSRKANAGMVGVNIGVPVPREPFSFGGWNDSKFGVGDITGESSVRFWTKEKKVTVRWFPDANRSWMD
jgi:malonate-semialdehyde dehydrogenase (acetylating)/methylmalonate-semialdehyde dehydrogenase